MQASRAAVVAGAADMHMLPTERVEGAAQGPHCMDPAQSAACSCTQPWWAGHLLHRERCPECCLQLHTCLAGIQAGHVPDPAQQRRLQGPLLLSKWNARG